eukprot:g2705.t1
MVSTSLVLVVILAVWTMAMPTRAVPLQKQNALSPKGFDHNVVVPSTVALDNLQSANENSLDVAKKECLDIPFSLCVGGQPMLPPAQPKSLVGHWTFDDMVGHDSSGMANGMRVIPEGGPARGGIGASAYFNGTNYGFINHIGAYESRDFTVAFWVFLIQKKSMQYRYLFHKGGGTPTLSIMSNNRLHLVVKTRSGQEESMDSKATLTGGRWTHVAIVVSGKAVQLYVNGIVDGEFISDDYVQWNRDPIFLARGPSQSGTACYIDDLRILRSAVTDSEVQAWSFGSFGMVPPGTVKLGCSKCSARAAGDACAEETTDSTTFQICTERGLYSGAITVARAQGWTRQSQQKFWTQTEVNKAISAVKSKESDLRMGLCCASS